MTEPGRSLHHPHSAWQGHLAVSQPARFPYLSEKNKCPGAIAQALPLGLAYSPALPDGEGMSRSRAALIIGLVGFAGYVLLVLTLGDFVLRMHWIVQMVYFAIAGTIWVWPAKRLIYWGAGK